MKNKIRSKPLHFFFLISIFSLYPGILLSQTTYTFIGNGNWEISSNWNANLIPPSFLPDGSTININPAIGDSCVLNSLQIISIGAFFNVVSGANLIVKGNLNIRGSSLALDSTFTDIRDGQVYTYRHIGTQVWMTKNLNYDTTGSWCYGNNATNCNTYGRLYNWNTALTVAPAGWHLPSDEEWTILTSFLGGDGGAMKSVTGWNSPNTGATNNSGFSGLPGGVNDEGFFDFIGTNGYWWSSTELDTMYAWRLALNYYFAATYRGTRLKTNGLSVRCVRNL